MTPPAQVRDDGLDVERHVAARDGRSVAVALEEQPARDAAAPRQPGAAGVEGADAAADATSFP